MCILYVYLLCFYYYTSFDFYFQSIHIQIVHHNLTMLLMTLTMPVSYTTIKDYLFVHLPSVHEFLQRVELFFVSVFIGHQITIPLRKGY